MDRMMDFSLVGKAIKRFVEGIFIWTELVPGGKFLVFVAVL